MGLIGILLGLGLLILLAYRGWSVLLLAPAAALVAAAFAREPLLAHWTQTFMGSGARFIAQFFPIFLLGALFGKLMEDSGSVTAIADFMTKKLGERRAILAVVLAGAIVTYGGVSLFVAFFVLVPMAQALFQAAAIPKRLIPATIALGIPRSRHDPKILWVDDAEIVGDQITKVRPIPRNLFTQKTERRIGELGTSCVALVVSDVSVHEAP